MSFNRAVLGIVIGSTGGIVSGLFGVGGAVVIVPALTWLSGMSQHEAQGTSLGALLLPVGLLGFWEYYRNGHADIPMALFLALGLFLGAFLGAWLAQKIPTMYMRMAFGGFLVLVGVRLMLF